MLIIFNTLNAQKDLETSDALRALEKNQRFAWKFKVFVSQIPNQSNLNLESLYFWVFVHIWSSKS